MRAPLSKKIRSLLPYYGDKIVLALLAGKPVTVLRRKNEKDIVLVQIGYPKQKSVNDYPPESVLVVDLDKK